MIDSYLLGAQADDPMAPSWLRVGAHLDLQPKGRSQVEVRAPDGRAVGWLPPEDARTVVELMGTGTPVTARVRGVVPAFQRSRVQLAIEAAVRSG